MAELLGYEYRLETLLTFLAIHLTSSIPAVSFQGDIRRCTDRTQARRLIPVRAEELTEKNGVQKGGIPSQPEERLGAPSESPPGCHEAQANPIREGSELIS